MKCYAHYDCSCVNFIYKSGHGLGVIFSFLQLSVIIVIVIILSLYKVNNFGKITKCVSVFFGYDK